VEAMVKVFIRHTGAKLVLYEVLFWKCGLSAVSGVSRGLNQEGRRSWKGSTGHCRGSLANTQKKNWEMVVNPDVDGYTKIQNHGKILQKVKKNYWKPKHY